MSRISTALVTGGAEGIGACTVKTLAAKGFKVLFCDINEDKGRFREEQLQADNLDVTYFQCDVSSYDSVSAMSSQIRSEVSSIDLIVNNAGIADPAMNFPTEDISNWEKVIHTNLSGSFYIVNSLLDIIAKDGCIILISSTRALQSEANTLAYSASKGGLVSLAHSLAVTLSSKRIRANSILPGWIDTSKWKIPQLPFKTDELDNEQHPSGRVGVPEDIANLICFLASNEGEWINGQSIVVDGGMTKRMIYFDEDVVNEAVKLRKSKK